MIRDGVPVANGRYATHGIMVEILVDGQFGYYGTPDISKSGVEHASRNAFDQAKAASKYSVHSFTKEARPKSVGTYKSPFVKDIGEVSAKELNILLLEAYKHLKVSDKIVSASSLARTSGLATQDAKPFLASSANWKKLGLPTSTETDSTRTWTPKRPRCI